MAHSVKLSPQADRQLNKLPAQVQQQLAPVVSGLAANPRPSGVVKMKGPGNLYRVRSGDYRITYTVRDAELLVLVVTIGNRREVYRRR